MNEKNILNYIINMGDLSKIIDIVKLIKTELDSLIKLNDKIELSKQLYDEVLINIANNLTHFNILEDSLLGYNSLYRSHINIIKHKLSVIKLDIIEIKEIMIASKKGCYNFICSSKGVKFSVLNNKLNNSFKDILPILKDLNDLQHGVLGETIRIENKIFKYGWLLSGKNELNKSKLDETTFKNNLFIKYKKELTESLKDRPVQFNPESKTIQSYMQANISIITDCIDSIFNNDNLNYTRDHKISINELNRTNTLYSLHECLDIEAIAQSIYIADKDKDKNKDMEIYNIKSNYIKYTHEDSIREEEERELQKKLSEKRLVIKTVQKSSRDTTKVNKTYDNFKDIFTNTITLEYNDVLNKALLKGERPEAKGYGHDFPCCLIKRFNIQKENVKSDKIIFIINAEDQNWGGTGHINVRYTLNSNKSEIGFFINREKVQKEILNSEITGINKIDLNNNYLIEFPKQDLEDDDNILTFYLFCPKWNGSVGHVKNIKVNKEVDIN